MNIYLTDESAKMCATFVPEYNWAGRAMDAMELVAVGLEYWEGEECELECHEPKSGLARWVKRDRKNWQWVVEYGYWLLRELNRRKCEVPSEYLAFVDYVFGEYGACDVAWGSIPPICLPKLYKSDTKSSENVVKGYRKYVKEVSKMRHMSGRQPVWLD